MIANKPLSDDTLSVATHQRVDRVCVEFEAAWKAGVPPKIEILLDGIDEPERSTLLRELLLLELDYRSRKEHRLDVDEYRTRFPEHRDLIGAAFTTARQDQENQEDLVLSFLRPSDKPDHLGRLGTYEIIDLIGHGGMALVFKGIDEQLNRLVAIKVPTLQLASNATARRRFQREAQAAAAITNDHVITIHAVEEVDGLPLLVMQYVDGISLETRIRRDGPLELYEILRIGSQTAQGLAAAHAQGIIHRDIKPSNILLEDGVERVKVTDFGLARAVDDVHVTRTGVVVGTPQYMSPEQARCRKADQRSDLFSLGCVLYAMCAGRPPFRAETILEAIHRVCEDRPRAISEINPDIPAWFIAIIDRLLAKDPDERFQDAAELGLLLQRHLAHLQQPEQNPRPAMPEYQRKERPAGSFLQYVRPARLVALTLFTLFLLLAGLAISGPMGLHQLVVRVFGSKTIDDGPPLETAVASEPIGNGAEVETAVRADPSSPPTSGNLDIRIPFPAWADEQAQSSRSSPGTVSRTETAPNGPATAAGVGEESGIEDELTENGVLEAEWSEPTVHALAFSGTPYGVGQVEFRFANGRPDHRPDQLLLLRDKQGRTRYPSFDFDPPPDGEANSVGDEEIHVYFLFEGDQPLDLSLLSADATWASGIVVPVKADPARYQTMRDQWWQHYPRQFQSLPSPQRTVSDLMSAILARRMGCSINANPRRTSGEVESTKLERQFESAVRMLFGIDSVLLAMQDDYLPDGPVENEYASQPLPQPVIARTAPIPSFNRQTVVESLALHVPKECFYVRCRSLANYLWFRDFLLGWGGSLQEIIATSTIDYEIRDRIERQLGIDPIAARGEAIDDVIADMALVGSDLFFRDGPAVGVLFQARDSDRLSEILHRQREAVARTYANVDRQKPFLAGSVVSLFSTPDNAFRSFYARDGEYHLVTNCQEIALGFLQCKKNARSLGGLEEFRYARSKVAGTDSRRVFIYLSDPFFRNLVSPKYRMEMSRRNRVLTEIAQIRLAGVVAASEGKRKLTVKQALERGYLPQGFGRRADKSRLVVTGHEVNDSLRGKPGVFLPIPDTPLEKATPGEIRSYDVFGRQYLRQWQAIDPVVVAIDSMPTLDTNLNRVSLKVFVTPYARDRYAFLARHLAQPTNIRCMPISDDLLSLDAGLRDSQGRQYQLRLGLVDETVPFQIRDGAVIPQGEFESRTLAAGNTYALITPQGEAGLQLLSGFGHCIQSSDFSLRGARPTSPSGVFSLILLPFNLLERLALASTIDSAGQWTVVAQRASIRDHVLYQANTEHTGEYRQARFRMADPSRSAALPYITAQTYMESRRASAENAILMNCVTQHLNLPPDSARRIVEYVLGGRLVCPLGGDYQLTKTPAGDHVWASTSWTEPSLYDETVPPPDYRFAFLDWLRGMDVDFGLTRDTLHADIQLTVSKRD